MAEQQLQEREAITPERLDYYRQHPEEIDATHTELVEALAISELDPATLGETQGDKTVKGAGDKPADEAVKPAAEAAKPEAAKAAAEPGTKPEEVEGQAVATKDGKHVLPFEVLKEARDGRTAAEAALAEAQRTALALADQVKALRAGRAAPAGTEAHTADELQGLAEQVGEQAPWLKEAMEKLVNVTKILREEVTELRGRTEQSDAETEQELQGLAAAAIEANPTLVLWQEKAPALWNEAVKFDKMIRSDEELAQSYPDFGSRFNAVVEMVKARHTGQAIPLPQPVDAPTAKPSVAGAPAVAKPSPEEIARAKAALASASDDTVRTLSDIPGGAPPVSPDEQVERMDPVQIANKFSNMTEQQLLNWVRTH